MNIFKDYITFFLLLFYCLGLAQSNKENVEFQTYKSLKDSIHKYSKTDILKAISFSENYIHKAQQEENIKEEFNGHYYRSQIYFQNGDYENAYTISNSCVNFSKTNSLNVELIKSYLLRGLIKSNKSEWTDSSIIDDYNNALRVSKDINDFHWTHTVLGRLSVFYTISGEIEKSIKIQKETIIALEKVKKNDIYEKHKKWGLNIRDYYNYLAKAYILLKEADSAKKYNQLFYLNLDKKNKNYHYWKREFYISEGGINLLKGNTVLSKEYYIKAYSKSLLRDKDEGREFQKAYYLGSVAFKEKKYKKVIDLFESVKDEDGISSEAFYLFNRNYYKYLAQAYLHSNNFEKASYYLEKQLTSISKNNSFKNNIKSKFKEIEIEEYNKELNRIKTEKNKQKGTLTLIIIILIISIVAPLFYIKNQKKKNKQKFDTLLTKFNKSENARIDSIINLKPKLEIKDSKIQAILKDLELLEQKKYYLNINCSLSSIAKEINTNTSYLSKIINSHYKKSFNAYINELRINYVIQRLKTDRLFRRYSIQSIANEIGFKSKESFNKAFRKETGILPSFYIRQLELTV